MRISILAAALAVTAGATSAQDFYAGVGFDYNHPHSGDHQQAATLLLGAAFDVGTLSFGIEADYGAATAFKGDFDTARLRVLAGYDFGNVTAFGTAGGTRYMDGEGNYDGYNLGLGVQGAVTDKIDLRGEMIRDFMSSYDNNITTTRLAAIYSF